MKNLLKKKSISLSCVAICILAIVASISTNMSYNNISNTIEPVAEKEIVNITVDADRLKTPLAITDDEKATITPNGDVIYDESMVEATSDPSVEIGEGCLLEDGGEYIEPTETQIEEKN